MRLILLALIGLNCAVQYGLWAGHVNVFDLVGVRADIASLRSEVAIASRRNASLRAEVEDLRAGKDALEERARADLGLIRADETFFQIIESEQPRHSRAEPVQPRY